MRPSRPAMVWRWRSASDRADSTSSCTEPRSSAVKGHRHGNNTRYA
jgi:hypothetical protein